MAIWRLCDKKSRLCSKVMRIEMEFQIEVCGRTEARKRAPYKLLAHFCTPRPRVPFIAASFTYNTKIR
jgi:hypothetical protein